MFENFTMNLNTLYSSCAKVRVVRLKWSLHFFMRAATSKMRANNSTFHLQISVFIQSHKQKS